MTRYIFTAEMWAQVREAELADRDFSRLLHVILDDAFCGADRSEELTAAGSVLFLDLRLDAAAAEERDLAARAEKGTDSREEPRFVFTPAMWEMLQRSKFADRKFCSVITAAVDSVLSGEDRTADLGLNLRAVARALCRRSLRAAAGTQHDSQNALVEAYRERRLSASASESSVPEGRSDAGCEQAAVA